MSRSESFSIDAMRSHLDQHQQLAGLRTRLQAERELRDEEFRRRVEAEKERIRKRRASPWRSLLSVIFPFTITIKRNQE